MIKKENIAWVFYLKDENVKIPNCGKWMYFFSFENLEYTDKLVQKAVLTHVVDEAKRTASGKTGVCCFYIDGNDKKAHKKILKFFLENGMIKKTKAGKLYNIGFKFDVQTLANRYGKDFKAKYSLSDFVDLETGHFL